MKIIEKKILPKYFKEVCEGKKTFEVRMDDGDNYQVGDTLILKEGSPDNLSHNTFVYTGNQLKCQITYILTGKDINGVYPNSTKDNLVILGISMILD